MIFNLENINANLVFKPYSGVHLKIEGEAKGLTIIQETGKITLKGNEKSVTKSFSVNNKVFNFNVSGNNNVFIQNASNINITNGNVTVDGNKVDNLQNKVIPMPQDSLTFYVPHATSHEIIVTEGTSATLTVDHIGDNVEITNKGTVTLDVSKLPSVRLINFGTLKANLQDTQNLISSTFGNTKLELNELETVQCKVFGNTKVNVTNTQVALNKLDLEVTGNCKAYVKSKVNHFSYAVIGNCKVTFNQKPLELGATSGQCEMVIDNG